MAQRPERADAARLLEIPDGPTRPPPGAGLLQDPPESPAVQIPLGNSLIATRQYLHFRRYPRHRLLQPWQLELVETH